MKNFKTALKILLTVFTVILLVTCRTPKDSTSNIKDLENKNIENNISLAEALSIDEVVRRSVEMLKSGKYGIVVNHVEYDTDKPINPETGKPPTKSETETTVTAEEDTKQIENTETDKSSVASSELQDKTKDKTKTETVEKTKSKKGFETWQIVLMCIGLAAVIGFIVWLLKKFKLWKRLF